MSFAEFYRRREKVNPMLHGVTAGYRKELGVAPNSKMDTFAALRLEVDTWRWAGVPFVLRPI